MGQYSSHPSKKEPLALLEERNRIKVKQLLTFTLCRRNLMIIGYVENYKTTKQRRKKCIDVCFEFFFTVGIL